MIMLDDLLECLNFYNCNNVPPCLCEPFLKQESQLDKYGIEVHFADNDGRQFYAAEDDRNTLYCYVSCMDDSPSPKKIVLSIETAIYAFRKKRITNRFGDKTKSVIQLCINMSKLDVGQIKNILRLLEIQFIKYRNWLSPQEHLFDPDNLLTLNKLGVVPREQTSFRSRSIGLWIWDQVHIHGDMQIDAIEKAIELKSLAIGENGHWSDLNRKYRLAKLCIDKMEVLNLTAL